jgi:hypothetical protein
MKEKLVEEMRSEIEHDLMMKKKDFERGTSKKEEAIEELSSANHELKKQLREASDKVEEGEWRNEKLKKQI